MPQRLLYGITGGISAYKAPLIVREFQKKGIEVRTVVTDHALQFVTATTLASLTGQPVFREMFSAEGRFDHLDLARWTDVLLVAPATANIMAKFAWGVADDLLSTIFVSNKRPVVIAPAMNHDMWADETTRRNVRSLMDRGVDVVQPETGYLACVQQGTGRMAEPADIVERTMRHFGRRNALEGKRVLVTAGATREHIDPVRFISNRSTGKMGFAVAAAFMRAGAQVTLIAGPTDLVPPLEIDYVGVTSAAEMFDAVMSRAADTDVIVKTAAVADYTPAAASDKKLKKSSGPMMLELVRTKDILKSLGELRRPGQLIIGFSAETHDHLLNASTKLRSKNLDMIVLNDVTSADAGFGADTNRVTIIWPTDRLAAPAPPAEDAKDEKKSAPHIESRDVDGFKVSFQTFPLMSKTLVAERIVDKTIEFLRK